MLRIGLFSALGLALIAPAARSVAGAAAVSAGLAAGISVAAWAARRTRFEVRDAKLYYVPHAYAGIAVSLLFLGRLVYRYAAGLYVSAPPPSDPAAAMSRSLGEISGSPATLAVFFILAGYYSYYYLYLLRRSSRPGSAAAESRHGSAAIN